MTSLWMAGIRFFPLFLFWLAVIGGTPLPAAAATPTHEQAMAACRAKYGKKLVNAIINKNGSLTCQWRMMREMTRAEAYETCKKQHSATTVLIEKKKGGWFCRYYGRY